MIRATYYRLETIRTPRFEPRGPYAFEDELTVAICCDIDDAEIYYTLDGTEPSVSNGAAYTEPIDLTETTELKAVALKEGMWISDTASTTYRRMDPVESPFFDPPNQSVFEETILVEISCPTDGTTIYYTLDGSVPDNTEGTLYTQPIRLTVSAVITARAYKEGMAKSPIVSAGYRKLDPVTMPFFTPPSGTVFEDWMEVEIFCEIPGSTIYYTTDGKIPDAIVGTRYTGPIRLTQTTEIKAKAFKEGMAQSPVAFGNYRKMDPVGIPVFDPPNGTTFFGSLDVRIYSATPGATVYYTTNGTTPSAQNGTVYAQPVRITETGTFKAIAYKAGMAKSPVATATFTRTSLTGTQKWFYQAGQWIDSSPAIGPDGTIYVGADDGRVHAVNPNGTRKWTYFTGNKLISSPAVGSDGTVYIGVDNGSFYAVNSSGSMKWKIQVNQMVLSSPAIGTDGTVYIGSMESHTGMVHAITPNGSIKWSLAIGQISYSSVMIGSDGTLYVGSLNNHLYAINPNGTIRWTYNTGRHIHASPAIAADGTIYIGNGSGRLYAVNPNGGLKWSFPTGGFIDSSAAVGSDGTIYFGSADGKLYALHSTGSLKWSFQTGGRIQSSPMLGSDGTVYVASLDGKLYALDLNGNRKWEFVTLGPIDSSPTLSPDGTIYIGSQDNRLYAIYGSGRLADAPWPKFRHNLRNTGNSRGP